MVSGIYGLFDKKTGECLYIGQSSDVALRMRKHRERLVGLRHLDSFNKYFKANGCDITAITFTIIEECLDVDDIKNSREIYWFNFYSPRFYGQTPSNNRVWRHSDHTKSKISSGVQRHNSSRSMIKNTPLVCPSCSKKFFAKRSRSKYCSVYCRNQGRSRRRIEVAPMVVNDILLGYTRESIARKYSVSRGTVDRIRKDFRSHGHSS